MYMYVYKYIYVYINIYVYIYTHIYTYIHMYGPGKVHFVAANVMCECIKQHTIFLNKPHFHPLHQTLSNEDELFHLSWSDVKNLNVLFEG